MGNLYWAVEPPADGESQLRAGIQELGRRGYWASPFPEGDGITFNRSGGEYKPDRALEDFREALPQFEIEVGGSGLILGERLGELAGDTTLRCTYLAPVVGLRIEERLHRGATTLHPPVDGIDNVLADHPWAELCDAVGADVDRSWAPGEHVRGTTRLLRFTLIERVLNIPLALLHRSRSVRGQEALLRFVLEDADRGLDPIRFELCSYRKLEYLPAHPGWVDDFAEIYLVPSNRWFGSKLISGKPYVLRVANNWLGMELEAGMGGALTPLLENLVDEDPTEEMTMAAKAALRAFNRAFYLIDLEAAFLHLVYAIDALSHPDRLTGKRQRAWVCALASHGNVDAFDRLLGEYDRHYGYRNKIVHEGRSFAEIGVKGEEACQFMCRILALCIRTMLVEGFEFRSEAAEYAYGILQLPECQEPLAAFNVGGGGFTLPITNDARFTSHMQA